MSQTLTFRFYPEKIQPRRKSMMSLDGVAIMPGINETDAKIQEHYYWDSLLDKKAIEILPDDTLPVIIPKEPQINLMSIEMAKPMIEKEGDLDRLRRWLDEDPRKGIKELVTRQINYLESK